MSNYKDMLNRHHSMESPMQGRKPQPIDPKAARLFAQPAVICGFCGEPMGDNDKLTLFERKWSIHEGCRLQVENQLDRQTGILSERK